MQPRNKNVIVQPPKSVIDLVMAPSEGKNLPNKLEVVAVGPDVTDLKPGDMVCVKSGPINKIPSEKGDYFVVDESAIIAIINPA